LIPVVTCPVARLKNHATGLFPFHPMLFIIFTAGFIFGWYLLSPLEM